MLLSAKYNIKGNDSTISPIVLATKIHAIIACQLLTTITILIAMIWGKTYTYS